MTEPVNLENLREMTGGEPELEKELSSICRARKIAWTAMTASTGGGQKHGAPKPGRG